MFPDEEEISKPSGERRGKRISVRKHSPYRASDAKGRYSNNLTNGLVFSGGQTLSSQSKTRWGTVIYPSAVIGKKMCLLISSLLSTKYLLSIFCPSALF